MSNVCSYHLTKGNYFLSFTFQYVTVMKLEHSLISFRYYPAIYPDLIYLMTSIVMWFHEFFLEEVTIFPPNPQTSLPPTSFP